MKKKSREHVENENIEAMLDHLYKAYKLGKDLNLQPLTLNCFSFLAKALKEERLEQRLVVSNQP